MYFCKLKENSYCLFTKDERKKVRRKVLLTTDFGSLDERNMIMKATVIRETTPQRRQDF